MPQTYSYLRSFAGGELSREMAGRIDDAKLQVSASEITNMYVDPRGFAARTPGTLFVAASPSGVGTADPESNMILIPFIFSEEDTLVIGITRYDRIVAFNNPDPITLFDPQCAITFYSFGAQVLSPSTGLPYTLQGPWSDLSKLSWSQSADTITITSDEHPPYELIRNGPADWTLLLATFGASTTPPSDLTASPFIFPTTPGPIAIPYEYAVTSVGQDNTESDLSVIRTATVDFNTVGRSDSVSLSWPPVTGANGYNIYRRAAGGGSWGLIRQTANTFTNDDRFVVPNFGVQPPINTPVFTAAGDYPGTVERHQQRRWFAGYRDDPLRVDASRTGSESDFSIRVPAQDTDALRFRIASNDGSPIRHLVALQEMLAFTSAGVFKIDAVQSNALTPTTLNIQIQDNVGSSRTRPIVQESDVLYESARGSSIRRLSRDAQGYRSIDLTVRARHLFERRRIVSMAFQRNPVPILWCVLDNGNVVALTYLPEEDVYAWHRHSFGQGKARSVVVVPEGNEDAVYFVVRWPARAGAQFPGSIYDTVERLAPMRPVDTFNQPYLQSAMLSIDPPGPRFVFTGLTHLRGKLVQVRQNDKTHRPVVVAEDGTVTLQQAFDIQDGPIWIGRPFISRLVTMPLSLETPGFVQALVKNFSRIYLKLFDSLGGRIGIVGKGGEVRNTIDRSNDDAEEGGIFAVNWAPMPTDPAETSKNRRGDFEVSIRGTGTVQAQLAIEQREPLPFVLQGITMEVTIGGGYGG